MLSLILLILVYIIHRRDKLRASKIMVERVHKNPKIEIVYNAIPEEILGDESRPGGLKVTGIRLRDPVAGQTRVLPIEGVFLAIGHIPNTSFLKGMPLVCLFLHIYYLLLNSFFNYKGVIDLDKEGYAITKSNSTATKVPGLYVAGDAQDRVFRQAITAAGSGCMAAIESEVSFLTITRQF